MRNMWRKIGALHSCVNICPSTIYIAWYNKKMFSLFLVIKKCQKYRLYTILRWQITSLYFAGKRNSDKRLSLFFYLMDVYLWAPSFAFVIMVTFWLILTYSIFRKKCLDGNTSGHTVIVLLSKKKYKLGYNKLLETGLISSL